MRWIVNPPSSAFCDLPPGPPGQTKTSQGVEKTALIVKRSIVVSTDDATRLCVCAALAKTMIAQQQLRQNHNRTPHRHLLALSHRKIIKKCQFAFFLLFPDMWGARWRCIKKLNNFQSMSLLIINIYLDVLQMFSVILQIKIDLLINWNGFNSISFTKRLSLCQVIGDWESPRATQVSAVKTDLNFLLSRCVASLILLSLLEICNGNLFENNLNLLLSQHSVYFHFWGFV